jgi:membrane-bound serine protease (ClpP class)
MLLFFIRGVVLFFLLISSSVAFSEEHVALAEVEGAIFPGTSLFIQSTIKEASDSGAKAIIIKLNTPGGSLQSTQEIVQAFFESSIPVIVFVTPTGGSAASAGVFITLAAHVAVMGNGTTIGAAHPVAGDGKDIESDMRLKVENITTAMIKSISEQRGRNTSWAEKAVKESASLTEKEAVAAHVIDLVVANTEELMKKIEGREVVIKNEKVKISGLSGLPLKFYAPTLRQKVINVLANPTVAGLLWLAATTGIVAELYNPGLIVPGVVGAICLLLALASNQIIPLNLGGILLIVLGVVLLFSELWVPSGILAIGGILAIIFGALYLVDTSIYTDMTVNFSFFLPALVLLASTVLFVVYKLRTALRAPVQKEGGKGFVGINGKALTDITHNMGKVLIQGEIWEARVAMSYPERGSSEDPEASDGSQQSLNSDKVIKKDYTVTVVREIEGILYTIEST